MTFYANSPLYDHSLEKYGMTMYKEFNSTCITLVAFFDPKHFLVENRAPASIYFLTPNRQYKNVASLSLYEKMSSLRMKSLKRKYFTLFVLLNKCE